jgi:hypothetical protein
VAEFVGLPVSGHSALIKKATELAASANEALANYYIKVMNKLGTDEGWVTKEAARLKKLAEKSATMSSAKVRNLSFPHQYVLQVAYTSLISVCSVRRTSNQTKHPSSFHFC